MLNLKKITRESLDAKKVEMLYLRAFPENEREHLDRFWERRDEKEVYGIYERETFCGFMQLVSYRDMTQITYFAVDEKQREKRYGSAALELLGKIKQGQRIMADIEKPSANAANKQQRNRRKKFYLRNGYKPTMVDYQWRGESYEILSRGGLVSEREYKVFWDNIHKEKREDENGIS